MPCGDRTHDSTVLESAATATELTAHLRVIQELNLQHTELESAALPIELMTHYNYFLLAFL